MNPARIFWVLQCAKKETKQIEKLFLMMSLRVAWLEQLKKKCSTKKIKVRGLVPSKKSFQFSPSSPPPSAPKKATIIVVLYQINMFYIIVMKRCILSMVHVPTTSNLFFALTMWFGILRRVVFRTTKGETSLPWFDILVKLPKGILLKNCPNYFGTERHLPMRKCL